MKNKQYLQYQQHDGRMYSLLINMYHIAKQAAIYSQNMPSKAVLIRIAMRISIRELFINGIIRITAVPPRYTSVIVIVA